MSTSLRDQVERLDADGDLLRLEHGFDGVAEPFAVATEAARANGPALLFEDVPGTGRLVSGVRGGPDRAARRSRLPWRRCAGALGLGEEASYQSVIERLTTVGAGDSEESTLRATERECDVTRLGLPVVTPTSNPLLTDGLVAATVDDEPVWAPIRGVVDGRRSIRLSVPAAFAEAVTGAGDSVRVSVALGVPTASVVAAHLQWAGARSWRDRSAPSTAAALGSPAVAAVESGLVPASAEVVIEGSASTPASTETDATRLPGPAARWECTLSTATLDVTVTRVSTREDPLIPCVPLGESLADDVHVSSLVESARLSARVNGYWGVSPVEWICLPAEAGLGLCLVASELLYAGFEWQLANTLFSFSETFDKVVILDADSPVDDLARALDDMWVKAHPSHDWHFSDAAAPAATAPHYRQDGTTGSRLYVNAAWDPQWDEEYIAPRVEFETMYPAELQASVEARWAAFGFDSTGGGGDT